MWWGISGKLASGLSGEDYYMDHFNSKRSVSELRPETVESILYMWRFTHDPKYREWGMEIAKVCSVLILIIKKTLKIKIYT